MLKSGKHGCVIHPTIECLDKREVPVNTLGKFRKEKNSDTELLNYKILSEKIDPDSVFTPRNYGKCEVSTKDMPSELKVCLNENKNTKLKDQLIIEKGLSDLSEYAPFVNIFARLRPLFIGINELDKHGYTYMDIHVTNTVYRHTPPHDTMFIDMETLHSYDELYNWDNLSLFVVDHVMHPPEFQMLSYFKQFYETLPLIKKRFTILDFVDKTYDQNYEKLFNTSVNMTSVPNVFKEIARRGLFTDNDSSLWIRFFPEQRMKDSLSFIQLNPFTHNSESSMNSKLVFTDKMYDDFMKTHMRSIANKATVYSLGNLLLDLVNQDFLLEIDSGVKIHPMFTDVMELIADMMNPNPIGRLSPVHALQRYDELIYKYKL